MEACNAKSIIEVVNSFKYLGLTIQSNLKFDVHISNIIAQISKGTGILYALKPFFPTDCLLKLYYAFVYPHLSLHILAWGGSRPNLLDPLRVAQNNSVRNLKFSSSASEVYSGLKLLRVDALYKLRLGLFMFKQINECGEFLCDIMSNQLSHSYLTRRIQQFRLPLSQGIVGESYFLKKGISLWNVVPGIIKDSPSAKTFKRRFTEYLRDSDI